MFDRNLERHDPDGTRHQSGDARLARLDEVVMWCAAIPRVEDLLGRVKGDRRTPRTPGPQ